ncbi:DUF1833 domain-containing protein [Methylobacterium isbiliense]|jgi:hypothetical protein|uniref:DUF1833 domain-containing protein n=1 Tax=Methylobacterium isbiliense TaxID=315478 RepID=A0ABQ4SBK3_9HYPH|nr:DUF1833 domain-containing protein [Methylobacterium isbiliense]MDN3622612.1 DUF1833 domain-containing protein [Methylobacterium isbiliense]GJE00540.1 hypothetical protein GMJLKIPL_2463 [Methylobacterium isbiliense]
MPRLISLNARQAVNAPCTDQVPVVLTEIRHSTLVTPLRLATDWTVRVSTEPLVYGFRHGGNVYEFIQMSAIWPDDQDRTAPKTTLVFANVTRDMVAPLRAILDPVYVDLTIVMADTPDVVEARYTNLRGIRGSWDASQVPLDISREPLTSEPMPAGRMTKARFPGLFR